MGANHGPSRLNAPPWLPWVLGLTPGVLVSYMLWQNPKYMMTMWESSTGQGVLVVAAGLQALGALVMWRMIKSL